MSSFKGGYGKTLRSAQKQTVKLEPFIGCLGKCYWETVVTISIWVCWNFCEQRWVCTFCNSLVLCLKKKCLVKLVFLILDSWDEGLCSFSWFFSAFVLPMGEQPWGWLRWPLLPRSGIDYDWPKSVSKPPFILSLWLMQGRAFNIRPFLGKFSLFSVDVLLWECEP
jgi:hypothetical protein